ncbi:alpha/beta hydrolase family protein [Sphingomonas sp. MMS24-J13]|uniref:alpha/beta hydrolase family protein n=1 Tax=Sphingomonas sp. MMS24-J13 TaxID=3238686 RepID=UPI00384FDEFA
MGDGWRARLMVALAALLPGIGGAETPAETAAVFGARESIEHLSLSPDGTKLAMLMPGKGPDTTLYVRGVGDNDKVVPIFASSGKPERVDRCDWVSNQRLVCRVYGITTIEDRKLPFDRLVAIDADGKNVKVISTRETAFSRGVQLGGGHVIDWLPDENGSVLMTRTYLPQDHTGSLSASTKSGLGVDKIDTATLAVHGIEPPRDRANSYISDGRGNVRIASSYEVKGATLQISGLTKYVYRRPGSRVWEDLSVVNETTSDGFEPHAVDHDLNVAYGFKKKDGRLALYSVALDGTRAEKLLLARDDVDVDGLMRIGRRNRVVGASYDTDSRHFVYFDPAIGQIAAALGRALPKAPIVAVANSSVDEHKLLIFAGSDTDPGVYYLFDRDKHDLHILEPARAPMVGRTLATMKPVQYRAADGTMVPAFLTLPPGKENAKGLPAIVMPHGGPSDRDSWGFDWLPQFYAARGFAVLQPEYRGSSGYGDAWYQNNGFKSWRIAIGDVTDAGRWLVNSGIADPHKLAIVGWSYGGYAALQSAVIAPDLFKAVVAVAPVTDLAMLKSESINWTDNMLRGDFIGSGDHIREGSPAQNAQKIKAPVLLVHGTLDANVNYNQSTTMASRLKSAGGKVQLITFDGLDHQLVDLAARSRLLRESDAFLQSALGL